MAHAMPHSWHKLILYWLFSLFATSTCAPTAVFDHTSALSRAASHTRALHAHTGIPPFPLPPSSLQVPKYEAALELAAGWPIVQRVQSYKLPTPEEMEANLRFGLNSSAAEEQGLIGRQSTLRVMIVGDSITQGQSGDFTWRYRIWQWFRQQSVSVRFVGPYTGTFQNSAATSTGTPGPAAPPPLYGSSSTSTGSGISVDGGYARSVDPAFLQTGSYNHFANWGRAMATDQSLIASMLQNTPADMILLALGFNDLGFFYSDANGLINTLKLFVQNARSVNPNIRILIANVPQRTFIRPDLVSNITAYNNMLPSYISQWTTAQSPLRLVEFQQNYACGTTSCPAAYDGLHPNAWGEFQIAQAFSKSLIAGFGIGSVALAIPGQNDPSVMRQIDTPTNFRVFSSPQGVSATWDPVYGAYGYDVSISINGAAASSGPVGINRWDSTWSLAGWTYAVSVRASCGNQYSGSTSTASASANPQLAPPPTNLNVQPISDGFTITFLPPSGPYTDSIVEYNIIFWDTEPSDCQFIAGGAFKSSPATIHGLTPGRNYLVAATTWNTNGQGLPAGARYVIPGSTSRPSTPSNLKAVSNDATSLHLTWNAVAGAAGYEVFVRNKTGGVYQSAGNVTAPCSDGYFLYPGTWNYQFCVAAWNGNVQSGQGPGVIPPQPASTVTAGTPGPTCAPPAQWCPSYGQPYTGPSVGGCAGCGGGGSGGTGTGGGGGTTSPPSNGGGRTCSTSPTHTATNGTPIAICGTSTYPDPSPLLFSFQAQFTGNIAYGNIVPTDIVSAISKTCTNGCGGGPQTTTSTGYYVSTTTSVQPSQTLLVPYQVTDDSVPAQDYQYFLQAIMAIVKGMQNSTTFHWREVYYFNGQPYYVDHPQETQWRGPSYVSGIRFELDPSTNTYIRQTGQLTYAVTSYTKKEKLTCGDIQGPISAALGAIPGIGPIFGIIGTTVCQAINLGG